MTLTPFEIACGMIAWGIVCFLLGVLAVGDDNDTRAING